MKEYKRKINGQEVIMRLMTPPEVEESQIKLEKVTQISGLCFNKDGSVLIISSKPDKWGIPGGKPENNESHEETLIREVFEEACVKIKNPSALAFMQVNFPNNPNKEEGEIFYQGRFIAEVESIEEMREDPATGKVFKRKFISPEEFTKFVKWEDAEDLISLAKNKLRLQNHEN